ncbi:hypothetical protein AB0G79_21315 [Streptomyces sp. NPDC020807]|uniref:hypothetical protein n=1 Tax=Streptomyces sp. NPDC020807 TaxID=3155119 RepID=UPI0033C5DB94
MREHSRDPSRGRAHHGGHRPTVWAGRATNRFQWLAAVAGAAFMALGITLAVESAWTSGITALVMAVVGCLAAGLLVLFGTLAFVHVAVKVDDRAMEVRCGHVGLPRRRIPLARVTGVAHVPSVTPRHWGGWGYRWRPDHGTGVIVRGGEGLVLRLDDGRTFTVTVDDAAAAVRVIEELLRARPPVPPPASGPAESGPATSGPAAPPAPTGA